MSEGGRVGVGGKGLVGAGDGEGGGRKEEAAADRDEGAPGLREDVGVARHSRGAAMPGGGQGRHPRLQHGPGVPVRAVVYMREQAVQLYVAQAQHAVVRRHVARHRDAARARPRRRRRLPARAPGLVRPSPRAHHQVQRHARHR